MEIFSVLTTFATQRLERGDLTEDEQKMLKKALLLLESTFPVLTSIEDPKLRDAIKLTVLSGTLIGHFIPYTAIKDHHVFRDQAKRARVARAKLLNQSPLDTAIVEERGDGPSQHPWKEADSCLEGINHRLKSAGHEPVSIDSVWRRLKKFPAFY